MRKVIAVAAALAIVGVVGLSLRADEPKNSIKDVMKKAHKEGLMKKVAGNKASDDEKKELLELYEDLSKNKPPQGDEGDWKKRTEAMVKAAKGAAEGDKKAAASLQKVVNCKGCHDLHKPA